VHLSTQGLSLLSPLTYSADDNKPVWPTWAVGALFRGARRIGSQPRDDDDDDNDDDYDYKPVWLTWAMGALFRGARCTHISRVCLHIPPSLRSRDSHMAWQTTDFPPKYTTLAVTLFAIADLVW
jgi:hypothetical protein